VKEPVVAASKKPEDKTEKEEAGHEEKADDAQENGEKQNGSEGERERHLAVRK
jgi:hypothetical protein